MTMMWLFQFYRRCDLSMRVNSAIIFMVVGFFFNTSLSWALESDAKQSIFIDANTAIFDKKQGKGVYEGNVKVVQGSIRIDADRLDVILANGKIGKLIAVGKLVKFKQSLGSGKEDFNGESLRAEYNTGEKTLVLIGQARLWQGENIYSSDRIEYDSENGIVKAGQKSSGKKRVHSVFLPKE